MKHKLITLGLLVSLVVMLGASVANAADPPKKYKIGAIEKTLINEHWQFMKDGYEFAAERYGVEV
ncbi:MAG: hypothetical protein ACETWB_08755, partial [Anaerolineae bacterium]